MATLIHNLNRRSLLCFIIVLSGLTTRAQQITLSPKEITVKEPKANDTTIIISYDLTLTKNATLIIEDVTSNSAKRDSDYSFSPSRIERTIDLSKEQGNGNFKVIIKRDTSRENPEFIRLLAKYKYVSDSTYLFDFIVITIIDADSPKKVNAATASDTSAAAKGPGTDTSDPASVRDIVKAAIQEAFNKETEFVPVGKLSLVSDRVKIYDDKKSVVGELKIDSVVVTVDNGSFAKGDVKVYADSKLFSNRFEPINIQRFRKKMGSPLENYDIRNKDHRIYLGDVLLYVPRGHNYAPDDVKDLQLNSKIRDTLLTGVSNLNALLNMSLYTDVAGLLGRKPNGLLQTDISGRFITNTGNFHRTDIVPFNYIEGRVSVSKYDSKFQSLDSSHVRVKSGPNAMDTVDRSYLNQIPWLRAEFKVNLLRARIGAYQFIYLNAGAQMNVVSGDSLYRRDKDILIFNYCMIPEVMYLVDHLGNFGLECSLKWYSQRVASSAKFANSEMQTVFSPQLNFYYFPLKKPDSRIYLRFNYFDNLKFSDGNFYQLQFGWKTDLKLSKN